jgi:hypothetical protein
MSQKEIKKYDIIKKLVNKELNGTETARILNLSIRQVRRLKKKVREKGIKGLVHGNRGKISNRAISDSERIRIIKLLHKHYHDFGPLLASEKLDSRHNIQRDKSTIRTIMINEGLWKPKQKKKEKHRSWRQRKASYGELLQYDGSYEHWFEDRGEKCCLLACVDDATGKIWAKFDKHEGVEPTFNFWREYIVRNGKPYAIYVDRFSTYSMNHKLAKENPDTLTQFQRAMETDLNVEIIHAKSAQAKGRVEVLFKTLQDRLVKELRLNNISTALKANEFLENIYLEEFNQKFNVEARTKTNLHKKLNKQEINKLDGIFSRQYKRVVRNDFTVYHGKNRYQLLKEQSVTICKKDRVTVEERMDQTIQFRLRGKYLNYSILPEKQKKVSSSKTWIIPKSTIHIPSANHPWRQTAKLEYLKKLAKSSR